MRRPRDVRGAGSATAFVGMHASSSVPPRSDSRTGAMAPWPLLRLLLVSGSCGLRTEILRTCRCNEGIGSPELRQGGNVPLVAPEGGSDWRAFSGELSEVGFISTSPVSGDGRRAEEPEHRCPHEGAAGENPERLIDPPKSAEDRLQCEAGSERNDTDCNQGDSRWPSRRDHLVGEIGTTVVSNEATHEPQDRPENERDDAVAHRHRLIYEHRRGRQPCQDHGREPGIQTLSTLVGIEVIGREWPPRVLHGSNRIPLSPARNQATFVFFPTDLLR